MGVATAIVAGAGIAAGASYLSGRSASKAAGRAANTQADLARQGYDIYADQTEKSRQFLEQQNALAMKELQPFKEFGLEALNTAKGYLDPNNPLVAQERAAYQKVLAQNLAARGLTASGTEIAGLTDFELGQGQQRRALAGQLAGLGAGFGQAAAAQQAGLGQGLASLYSNLGQTGAGIYGAMGTNMANAQMAGSQAMTQGLIGVANAGQNALLGFANLNQQQQNQQFQQGLLANLGYGGAPRSVPGIPDVGLGGGNLSSGYRGYF